jgi:hypothetical protein
VATAAVAPGNVRRRPTREKPCAPGGTGGARLKAQSPHRVNSVCVPTRQHHENPTAVSVDPASSVASARVSARCRGTSAQSSLASSAHQESRRALMAKRTLCDEHIRSRFPRPHDRNARDAIVSDQPRRSCSLGLRAAADRARPERVQLVELRDCRISRAKQQRAGCRHQRSVVALGRS